MRLKKIMTFFCPSCKQEIKDADIAKYFASIGGKISKRELTTQEAQALVYKRKWRPVKMRKKGGKIRVPK